MSVDRVGLKLGVVTFSFFGMIVITAILVGGFISMCQARRRGQDATQVIDLLTTGFVVSLVTARLFYIWNPPPSVARYYDRGWYLAHPFDLQIGPLAVWSGGLGLAGALIGGVAGVLFMLWRRRLPMRLWADLLTPGALIGLLIAPWANIVTRQMIGPPTGLPWGITVAAPPPPYDDFAVYPPGVTRFHPTPAYVSVWTLAALGIVLYMRGGYADRMRDGDAFALAAALYLPGVFVADFLRIDQYRGLLGMTGLQGVAVAGMIGLAAMWFTRPAASPAANHRAAGD